jgi:phosphonate degradation associated HDIG domain protein
MLNDDLKALGSCLHDPDAYCDALFGLLTTMGRSHFDEAVTQLDHARQTAALAEGDGAPDELVVASLLHDIGHLFLGERPDGRSGDVAHEKVGAKFLARRFGSGVAGPVALHVEAKRYLVAVDDEYCSCLSAASLDSLRVQGGPLSPTEVVRFVQIPHAGDAARLRRWDDAAKVPGRVVPDLDHWRRHVVGVLRQVAGPSFKPTR